MASQFSSCMMCGDHTVADWLPVRWTVRLIDDYTTIRQCASRHTQGQRNGMAESLGLSGASGSPAFDHPPPRQTLVRRRQVRLEALGIIR